MKVRVRHIVVKVGVWVKVWVRLSQSMGNEWKSI